MTKILKIYICDDDNTFADEIEDRINAYMNRNFNPVGPCNITVFNNAESLLKEFDKASADVVLLDIDMPKMNGFELASLLQERKEDILIMFVTNYEDKVYQSYEYHPFWFIRKSHMHDLDVILPRLVQKIEVEQEKKKLTFNLKTENYTVEIDINTLIYIESCKNNIIICDRVSGKKQVRCKITEAEKQLYPFNIIRIQNSVLVNCRYISKITSREVILTNGMHFGLSRSKINFVKEEFQNYVRSKII